MSEESSANLSPLTPYQFTKTGLVGEQRSSMLQSELQLLCELGKSHRRGHKLPPLDFTYGMATVRKDRGVAEAMSQAPERNTTTNPGFILVRDYFALNRAAIEAGMLSARDQSRFRTVHDIKKKIFLRDVSRTKKTHAFPDDIVFGIPYRASTPMVEVLQHHFADKWLETMQNKHGNFKRQQHDMNVLKSRYHTKTSLLRQVKIPVLPKPFPKRLEFAHTEHCVDSFRSEAERHRAFMTKSYNSTSHPDR